MSERDSVIDAQALHEDKGEDKAIRPKRLADYIGQANMREQLEIFIHAARGRGEALDHVLIFWTARFRQNYFSQYHR